MDAPGVMEGRARRLSGEGAPPNIGRALLVRGGGTATAQPRLVSLDVTGSVVVTRSDASAEEVR